MSNLDELINDIKAHGLENREDGWFDMKQIAESLRDTGLMSKSGLSSRLKKLVDSGVLETKVVYDKDSSHNVRVWRSVPKKPEYNT